ncbi:MAG: hypothetical protein AVDCRST_MAG86-2647, partial [uncultured Truepera sp.]
AQPPFPPRLRPACPSDRHNGRPLASGSSARRSERLGRARGRLLRKPPAWPLGGIHRPRL